MPRTTLFTALLAIVDHHGELIRKCLIASTNEKIAAIVREVLLEVALNQIVYRTVSSGTTSRIAGLCARPPFSARCSAVEHGMYPAYTSFFAMVRRRSRMQSARVQKHGYTKPRSTSESNAA